MNFAQALIILEAVSREHGFGGKVDPDFLTYLRDSVSGWNSLALFSGYTGDEARQAFITVIEGMRKLLAPA